MYKFKFADIGEGLHEGRVGEIFKKVGDIVKEGDNLFSVETDKVTTEIPSPVSGKVLWMSFTEGQTIHVGEEIYHFDDGSSNVVESKKEEIKTEKINEGGASVVGEVKVSNEVMSFDTIQSQQANSLTHKLSTPLARNLASKMGIDINSINGSGHNGRVLISDIQNHKSGNASNVTSQNVSFPRNDKRVKVSSMRRAIAKAMTNSWASVAYTNLTIEINMTNLWNQRKALTTDKFIAKVGTKVTFLPFIIKAAAISIKEFPNMNSSYDAQSDEIIQFGNVHMGVAVDTPNGLVVPVVRDIDSKNIFEINMEIQSLAKKARDGQLSLKEMTGSTITVTNYGSAGALFGTPVINYPNLSIVGVGAIVDKVYANENGSFYSGKVMYMTIAADHKWIDGAEIGNFGTKIKEILENPILLGVL